MNERVAILREAVVKITQMLSGQSITVTQRGSSAYVTRGTDGKPKVVNLPYLPDNASEELCMAIQGFLDHEVGHVLFSDFGILDEMPNQRIHNLTNLLEDARIERRMAERFAGCGYNLSVTGKFYLDKCVSPMLKKAIASKDANAAIGALMPALIRSMAGQSAFKEYMSDKMEIVDPIYSKIADLTDDIAATKSTRDCFELAKKIIKRISDDTKPDNNGEDGNDGNDGADDKQEDEQKGKQKGDQGDDARDDGQQGDGEDDKKNEDKKDKKSKKPKKGKQKKDNESDSGSDDDTDGDADGDADDGDSAESKDERKKAKDERGDTDDDGEDESDGDNEGESDGEGEGEGGPGEGADGARQDATMPASIEIGNENTAALLSALDKNAANNFDEAMSVVISNSAASAMKSAEYLVYTRDADKVGPLWVGSQFNQRMLTDMADKVDHMVGPIQKDLERAISARSLATWEAGRRSGRLHSANLSRLAVGDTRVFRKRHESDSKDVAVELVVDASGSMSGAKIHLATQAAYALAQVLERLNISNEVIAFTTGELVAHVGELEKQERKIGRRFSRTESLNMPILKSFNERMTVDIRKRFGWLPNSGILANNVDGECVEIAARRLLARREKGKVMIVLSDGAPNAQGMIGDLYTSLKKAVKNVENAGVKCVGIGIQSVAVRDFYPRNTVINRVDELPLRVIKELRSLLID